MKYLNVPLIASKGLNWNVFVAARQIGKTYGIFKRFMENHTRFIWMRRTTTELTRAIELGVFDELNEKEGKTYNIDYVKSEGVGWIYSDYEKTDQVGICMSMSTAKSYRGVNYFRYDELFCDEFIPEDGAKQSDIDGTTFIQALETIFGNRELPPNCLPPMKVWMASNTINLNDPILTALNLVSSIASMKVNKQKTRVDLDRSLYLYCGTEKSVAEAKKNTSLYNFIGQDNEMTNHILYGEFRGREIEHLRDTVNFKMYKCLFDVDGEVFVYVHKTEYDWYVSERKQDCSQHFTKALPANIRRQYASRYAVLLVNDMITYEKPHLIKYMKLLLG